MQFFSLLILADNDLARNISIPRSQDRSSNRPRASQQISPRDLLLFPFSQLPEYSLNISDTHPCVISFFALFMLGIQTWKNSVFHRPVVRILFVPLLFLFFLSCWFLVLTVHEKGGFVSMKGGSKELLGSEVMSGKLKV